MFLRLLGCLIMLAAIFAYRMLHVDQVDQKTQLVKQADVIAVASVTQVVPLQSSDSSPDSYKFRADVTTETVFKGAPPSMFIMYCPAKVYKDQPDFSVGRALILLKKDAKDNLIVFRPEVCVLSIHEGVVAWPKNDNLRDAGDIKIDEAIEDIKVLVAQ